MATALTDAPSALALPPANAPEWRGYTPTGIEATAPDGTVWKWYTFDMSDSDCGRRESHYAISADYSQERSLDWSAYDSFQGHHFVSHVEAGFPEAPNAGKTWFLHTMQGGSA